MASKEFILAGRRWTVLEQTEQGVICLADKLPEERRFGRTNDWRESEIRLYLNGEFLTELEAAIGTENILEFDRDLLSLDGCSDYGTCKDKVSVISFDEYRKYRDKIPNTEDYWWWTCTPDQTPTNNDSSWLRVVSPSGRVDFDLCYDFGNAVRPFCIFSSAIFESEKVEWQK